MTTHSSTVDEGSRTPAGYRRAIRRAWSLPRSALAILGLAVVFAVAYPESREALVAMTNSELSVPQPSVANFAAGPIQPKLPSFLSLPSLPSRAEREQLAVTQMLSKRYRVAQQAVSGFVAAAYRVGKQTSVDPLLILAVISIESRFNPVAESGFGAKGLMQIIPKFHREKLVVHGGEAALLDPEVNILVGAQVLREYLRRFGGTQNALQAYAGAFEEPTAQYSRMVLSERSRLAQTIARLRHAA